MELQQEQDLAALIMIVQHVERAFAGKMLMAADATRCGKGRMIKLAQFLWQSGSNIRLANVAEDAFGLFTPRHCLGSRWRRSERMTLGPFLNKSFNVQLLLRSPPIIVYPPWSGCLPDGQMAAGQMLVSTGRIDFCRCRTSKE